MILKRVWTLRIGEKRRLTWNEEQKKTLEKCKATGSSHRKWANTLVQQMKGRAEKKCTHFFSASFAIWRVQITQNQLPNGRHFINFFSLPLVHSLRTGNQPWWWVFDGFDAFVGSSVFMVMHCASFFLLPRLALFHFHYACAARAASSLFVCVSFFFFSFCARTYQTRCTYSMSVMTNVLGTEVTISVMALWFKLFLCRLFLVHLI